MVPTSAEIIAKATAPNAQDNITPIEAKKLGTLMEQWGMPYENIVAQTLNPQGPADVFTMDQVIQAGVTAPLNFYGQNTLPGVTDPDVATKGYNLGLEILLRNNTPAIEWYVKLYLEHNPGKTRNDAIAAAEVLPVFKAYLPATMDVIAHTLGF